VLAQPFGVLNGAHLTLLLSLRDSGTSSMKRRAFAKTLSLLTAGLILPVARSHAKTYLSIEQARQLLWADTPMQAVALTLTKEQVKSIRSSSGIRVRNPQMKLWKTDSNGWFIVDQIIGKHENIDMAFALDREGKVMGLEILTYRETYGFQVNHPKWRAQFHGRDHSEHLKLDHQIKNISGATLSCRHITDGINRLTQTWDQVLRHL